MSSKILDIYFWDIVSKFQTALINNNVLNFATVKYEKIYYLTFYNSSLLPIKKTRFHNGSMLNTTSCMQNDT